MTRNPNSPRPNCALRYQPDGYRVDRKAVMGRQSAGTVFWPAPGLHEQAWNRRFGSERDYSLCGVTHTVASATIIDALGQLLIAPTQPWDAVVCTSAAVRATVEHIIEQHADYLDGAADAFALRRVCRSFR